MKTTTTDKKLKPQVLETLETSEINHEMINQDSITKPQPVKIPVSDYYLLGADQQCWFIAKKRTRKGKDGWEQIKWFSSVEKAGEELFHLMVRTSEATSEFELLQAVTSSRHAIRKAFKKTFSLWDE